ncbi:MAG: hypothetical protein ACR2FF_06725 [Mycobacteriales bacterium]
MSRRSRLCVAVMAIVVPSTFLAACGGGGGGNGGGGGGRCSDPNPSNLALTFAAVVCVTGQASVTQSDGSTELKVRVMITNKDPNEFNVTTSDFKVLDSAGHDTAVDPATSNSRTGSSDCVYQQPTDNGWPVSPGASFTVPGPICFNLQPGQQPHQLVWQGDVAVTLS